MNKISVVLSVFVIVICSSFSSFKATKKMTVGEFLRCRTYSDVAPPTTCQVISFEVNYYCGKRCCDAISNVNAGGTFDSTTMIIQNRARPGFIYYFSNPVLNCSGNLREVKRIFEVEIVGNK